MENLKDRVTIYEVAKASGVSLATVSRVINNQGNVTEKTREKVQETIKKLGYKPSGLAQALATSKSTTIGVVIPSANYVYISCVLNGIAEVCKEKGYNLQLFSTSHSREDAIRVLEKVITSHVDGAIIFDDELDEEDVSQLNSYYVPTIVINNRVEGERVGCIVFGYEHNLRKIVADKLAKDSEKTPTFIHVHNCGRLLARTEKSFIEVCKQANREYAIFNCDDSSSRTYDDFMEYFKTHKQGYFVAYRDSIAGAIVNAATDSGLRVPEDVEVLSLIGTKYANITRPTLTSMNIDMVDVGRRAMYMLTDLAKNELEKKTYRIESVYVKRDSTKE
ncbi:MAG: LacI family DNA-binding transcriptional regulator [Firmicutes bacterium]|nr:LacI family DNA-binding transcriptional regulator [Candidatus Fiminaster equi]